ncbi:secreted protein with Por secretion system C-terminal sorting domain [Psychroflexus torquis ATCC 700755]|uniref:Secreted protein with Por secretion system C-terminal sorting domain n=1 Tax=Psychroflexus torquis (strain ATCC 700755 / CIP 106069 / ACAM 623) TaxID=313595 RepID=K4IJW3_PSYTT|nr:T9SS type A sorting domain-containing protein [Psychroflexus torquis]AFU69391.1 secreted protein with Por secretion system C-terminal sorting domain [Psychroflexus torquis ATCC 700755]
MKKIYLSITALLFAFSANAQIIVDDFEDYNLGPMEQQNPDIWRTWSDGFVEAESILVSADQQFSGSLSGFIGAGPGPQDAVLKLGNLESGDYTLEFQMYIPAGKGGYFNIQGAIPDGTVTGVFNSGNVNFNPNGVDPGLGIDEFLNAPEFDYSFDYPEGQWFKVSLFFDLDGGDVPTYQLSINGEVANETPIPFQEDTVLGGIDFFANDANCEYWIDDILFVEGTLSSVSFDSIELKAYPNPVVNVLNIKSANTIDNVSVYNLLGQTILTVSPNSLETQLDFSNLSKGSYLVEITVGNKKAVKKIIK